MLPSLRQSLRGRLIVLVAIVVLASSVLAALLIWRAFNNERAAVFRELGATARAVALLVDQRVQDLEALLLGLITAEELGAGDLERFYQRASRVTIPPRRWVIITDASGQQLINTRVPFGTALPGRELPLDIATTVSARRTYVSNIMRGPLVDEPALFVSSGIFAGQELRYIVSLVVSPEEFAAGIDLAKIAPAYVVAVIDRDGKIAARSRAPEQFVGQQATPDIAAAARSRREMFSESKTIDGIPVLAAVAPALQSGWTVALGAPMSELHASAQRLVVLGLLTTLGVLAAATGLAWWIARAVIHDVSALVADTRAVAGGALPAECKTELDETRFIAESLRTTAGQLHQELESRRRAQAELAAAKEELSRANAELERKVEERTASLSDVVRQMEEFTYSISHDLRAPVRAMTGFAQVLIEDLDPAMNEQSRALLQRIVTNGERLDRMIAELLAFSRVSGQHVELTSVDPEPLIRETLNEHPMLSRSADEIRIEGRLPGLAAHPESLKQVFTNLLTNAVKFVPPGARPQVRIFGEEVGGMARVYVCDNGIGIDPQFQDRLFRVFERVHVDRNFEGTGIGLAIVRRAIERMNGRVGVESDGRSGSCFWIELKAAPDAA